jgi:ribosome-binding protein aMBF1 (putative translation factor)
MTDMTKDDFNEALRAIGWSNREVARRLNSNETMVRYWSNGRCEVPEDIGRWLSKLAAAHASTPTPKRFAA